jgi:hypothetical protein
MVTSQASSPTRVELQLHEHATVRQQRELGAFVRHCIARIERDDERADTWTVKIVPLRNGFRCEVIVRLRDLAVESAGVGLDGPLAAWEALSKIEQLLRDNRVVHAEVSYGGR